ncbi:MAG TPA: hypothetical protein VE178_19970 [Silvibacterium sp.]|nr:hypothetical protein [Silvibacterium sp.]
MRKTIHIPLATLTFILGMAGCHSTTPQNQPQNAAQVTDDSQDPAMEANLAPAVNTTQPEQATPAQQAAPQSAPAQENPPPPPPDQSSAAPSDNSEAPSDQSYDYNAPVQGYQDQAQPT